MHKFFLFVFASLLTTGWCRAQEPSLQDLLNSKQFDAVIARTGQLTAADSADYHTLYSIGQAHEGLLQYKKAFDLYEQCLQMDTTNVDMLNTLARTAINLGRATVAESYFQRVLERDTTNFYANYQLARMYQQVGDYEKAVDRYNYLLERDTTNTTLLRNKADCYNRMERYLSAVITYFKAYNYNRENAGLANTLINTMLKSGDDTLLQDALALCDTALYYNPENRMLLRTKGMASFMNRKYEQADTLFSELLMDGDSIYNNLKYGGASKYYAGLTMASVDLLEKALAKDTSSVEVHLLLGGALGKTYDRARAYQLFDEAEELMQPPGYYTRLLKQSRAETLLRDNRRKEACILFYQLWEETRQPELLAKVAHQYYTANFANDWSTDEKERGLFFTITYIHHIIDNEKNINAVVFFRPYLQSLYDDMFFRTVSEQAMKAPDGKRSMLSVTDLRYLINRIPEEMVRVERSE